MSEFKQYSIARVRKVIRSEDDYDGWRINQRAPQVGDEGTIVEILQSPGIPDRYVVECAGQNGVSVWLAEFGAEELECE